MTDPARRASEVVRVLTLHARYACGRSGTCCTSGWPIPIEADRAARVRAALASGALRRTRDELPALVTIDEGVMADALVGHDARSCVFYRAEAHACAIHDALGHEALPLACRQFPRVSLRDPRGTSVTLSHYCPTAAALLDTDTPIAITADAAAFPAGGEYIGLDATMSLPPLLRAGMLMDWEAWWLFEAETVAWLGRSGAPIRSTLAAIARAVDDVSSWRPQDGALVERVGDAFAGIDRPVSAEPSDEAHQRRVLALVLDAMPSELRPATLSATRGESVAAQVQVRFVAAHAFASWMPHVGDGLSTWLASLDAALTLLEARMDVRTADLWLRHLVDPATIAKGLGGRR